MSQKASSASDSGLRWMVTLQGAWLALVFVLGAWWAHVLMKQAEQIVQLQRAAGLAEAAQLHWDKTQRMLFWESATFFLLLLGTTLLLMIIYWRDLKRTQQIRTFFAAVTHELRTPLTSIRLQAESIAESLPPSQESTHLVGRLLEDTQRLEAEVERTLQLARLKGGGGLYLQQVQLRPYLSRLVQSWLEGHAGRGEIDFEIGDVTVEADPSAVSVVFRNVLENSLRHAKRSLVKIHIRAHIEPDTVVLTVRDDGTGYDGDLRALGQLFHRGDASQGSGVGLHLVRELMRQMGGDATFATPGGFEVRLRFREVRAHAG